MARVNVTQVEGFDELNRKLKQLTDSVKRTEVLKLMRTLARPLVLAYRSKLPVDSGKLRASVAVKTIPGRKTNGNPAIAVVPGKSGKNDAYYKFMVIPKGTKLNGSGRGSRKGVNVSVPLARNAALKSVEEATVSKSEVAAAKLVQKQIDRLSV